MTPSPLASIFKAEGLQVIDGLPQRQKFSRDYAHFSPILTETLQGNVADLVVMATSETDVKTVVKQCVAAGVPLTVRGAGTGNYGQCVPMAGGVVLDVTPMNRIVALQPGRAVVEPGIRLGALDGAAQALGWELRMAPSTYQTATLGGFIGGGSAGMGSITYGLLAERGNVQALRLVTMEADPQVMTLEGGDTQAAIHAYGTNGIITQITVPLAPALPWRSVIVGFEALAPAIACGEEVAHSNAIQKKELGIHSAPIPQYFSAFKGLYRPGQCWLMAMICEYDWSAFLELVKLHSGQVLWQEDPPAPGKSPKVSLVEFNWNHTTLLARAQDPSLTYLQVMYQSADQVLTLQRLLAPEVMIHLELIRVGGKVAFAGLPLVKFTTGDRLQEIMAIHTAMGVTLANPHAYTLEGGASHPIPAVQIQLKYQTDPLGLLNPGKMAGFQPKIPSQ